MDGYQGQESDIVILSTVRGYSRNKSIGFLKDIRRMNVALTRAKFSLFIVGNAESLNENDFWKQLIQYAVELKTITSDLPPRIKNKIKTRNLL